MSIKRKLDSANEDYFGEIGGINGLAEYCRRSAVPRTTTEAHRAPGGDETASFYPLPPELNNEVLATLKQKQEDDMSASANTSRSSPVGIMQPPYGASATDAPAGTGASSMDEDGAAAPVHGPHCQGIPQLSVKYHGGTASELWALCPDCGTFSKVHEDQPVKLCYSP